MARRKREKLDKVLLQSGVEKSRDRRERLHKAMAVAMFNLGYVEEIDLDKALELQAKAKAKGLSIFCGYDTRRLLGGGEFSPGDIG